MLHGPVKPGPGTNAHAGSRLPLGSQRFCFPARRRLRGGSGYPAKYPGNFAVALKPYRVACDDFAFGKKFGKAGMDLCKRQADCCRDIGIKFLAIRFQVLQDFVHLEFPG